jgi:predicted transcriptional regulator
MTIKHPDGKRIETTISLSRDLMRSIDTIARAEGRSRSNWIERCLEWHMRNLAEQKKLRTNK